MVEVLAEALQPKNDPLALFPMELSLTRPTRPSAATVGLAMEGKTEV